MPSPKHSDQVNRRYMNTASRSKRTLPASLTSTRRTGIFKAISTGNSDLCTRDRHRQAWPMAKAVPGREAWSTDTAESAGAASMIGQLRRSKYAPPVLSVGRGGLGLALAHSWEQPGMAHGTRGGMQSTGIRSPTGDPPAAGKLYSWKAMQTRLGTAGVLHADERTDPADPP